MNVQSNSVFKFPGQSDFYRGKVRDVYTIADQWLVMIATDRISAFDVVLPKGIPYKGAVLNQLAAHMLRATKDICPNWLMAQPAPHVSIGLRCEPIRIEMVIRAYLTGHAWRIYKAGGRSICGVNLPEGLREHDKLPQAILTPTTKSVSGHDEDISRGEILAAHIVPEQLYQRMEALTHALFERGSEMAAARGLILVDSKYEFGLMRGELMLMDELHTPDSSRFFYAEGYADRQKNGVPQRQLSKEFVREWLISEGFQGKDGQRIPAMSEERIRAISDRYIELYEKLTGVEFDKNACESAIQRTEQVVKDALATLTTS